MGYTRQLGQLAYLITYDGSGNITVPASLTQGSVTSSMLKTDAGGKLVAAVAGTDFVAPAGLSAYVPTTRTITINGTAYDLSADRSWSIVSGVSSFNTRTGAIELGDTDVTGALGYTPVTSARTITINGTTYDLSADRSWSIVAGLSSFNTRTGAITLLDTDVTGALGYTPVTNARTITINGTTYDLSANRTWVVDTSSVTTRVIQKFTATASQTTFAVTAGYTVGMVDVFLNGIKLDNAVDFTATDGANVVLAVAAATGDIVEVYKYGGQFIANNTLRQSTLFTATAGQTTFTVNYSVGFVDVFYNGSKLDSSEFTATNGTSIVLGTACVLNDKVEVIAYNYTVGAFTGVGGSGTANYIPKWTASGTLGNSLIYDNGTNIGIGTSSPSSPLSIYGSGNMTSVLDISASTSSSVKTHLGQFSTNTYLTNNWYFNGSQNADSTSYGQAAIILDGTGFIDFATSSAGTNAPTARMRITSTGTAIFSNSITAGARIQAQGSNGAGTSQGGFLINYNTNSTSSRSWLINNDYNVFGDFAIAQTTTQTGSTFNNAYFYINPSGNIGIGTLSPRSLVDIRFNADRGIRFSSPGVSSEATISSYQGDVSNNVRRLRLAGDSIYFNTGDGSDSTGTERMGINSSGLVSMPYQPSFYAVSNAGSTSYSSFEVIVFNTTRHNTGSHFNTSNGRFTAPITGRYLFSLNIYSYGSYTSQVVFTINGSQYQPQDVSPMSTASASTAASIGFTVVFELSAGDYVEPRVRAGASAQIYRAHSHFTGQLLS